MTSTDKPIRIVLADDHQLVRTGLSLIINKQDDMQVVGEAGNGAQLLDVVKELKPDVVLLDMEMPVMGGKDALKHIKTDFPETRVIILTIYEHDSFIVDTMEAGASGYLLKDAQQEEVLLAIRTVMSEQRYFNTKVSEALLRNVGGKTSVASADGQESLNEKEIKVLRLICDEKTTAEIADELFLSPKTIEGYRKSLLEKTGCRNAVGLAIYAAKNGLL